MCQGQEKLLSLHGRISQKRRWTLSKKEQDTIERYEDRAGNVCAEAYDFLPLDLYQADARRFKIIDGKLMPALSTIEGLGEKAADAVMDAAKEGKFLSKDDFRDRTKVSKTVIDLMDDLGILGDLPESNQLSLFDLVG